MSALAQFASPGAWVFVLCGAALLASVAGTAFALRAHTGAADATGRPDQWFWDAFLGAAVAFPALLIPTLLAPPSGLVLGSAAVAAGVAAYRGAPRLAQWHARRRDARLVAPHHRAAQLEHRELLARWRQYELDPAYAIAYPDLSDVRRPATSALIKAIREAERLAPAPHSGYPAAVAALAHSLAAAERAAGVTGPQA